MKTLYRKIRNLIEYATWTYIAIILVKLPIDLTRDHLEYRQLKKLRSN